MKSLKKNNKGFTLIELLAVIVILGVLMIIAVPMVSKYIKEAKQNAFVATAKAYVSSARYAYLNGDYGGTTCATLDSGSGDDVYILFNQIDVDKSNGQSPFNKKILDQYSYVRINSSEEPGHYKYYVYMIDEGGNVIEESHEEELKKSDVKSGGTTTSAPSTYKAAKACTKQ